VNLLQSDRLLQAQGSARKLQSPWAKSGDIGCPSRNTRTAFVRSNTPSFGNSLYLSACTLSRSCLIYYDVSSAGDDRGALRHLQKESDSKFGQAVATLGRIYVHPVLTATRASEVCLEVCQLRQADHPLQSRIRCRYRHSPQVIGRILAHLPIYTVGSLLQLLVRHQHETVGRENGGLVHASSTESKIAVPPVPPKPCLSA
jgi:hypothetical protein